MINIHKGQSRIEVKWKFDKTTYIPCKVLVCLIWVRLNTN